MTVESKIEFYQSKLEALISGWEGADDLRNEGGVIKSYLGVKDLAHNLVARAAEENIDGFITRLARLREFGEIKWDSCVNSLLHIAIVGEYLDITNKVIDKAIEKDYASYFTTDLFLRAVVEPNFRRSIMEAV